MELGALKAFHFMQPLWLLSLPLLWLLATWFAWQHRRDGGWSQVIDAELLPALRLQTTGRSQSPWWLLSLLWTLAVVALAGPAWQRESSTAFRAPADWIVVLDLSPSMAAADVAPNRATRARYAIADLLDAAKDARVALVVFAGEAHTVAPLTTDVATVSALLSPLSPGIMPEAGDALAPALNEVMHLIDGAASQHAQVVVLSDGIADPAQALQAAQHLRQQGATLHVIGVGTISGAPAPDSKGGFAQDAQGHSVLSKLPVDQLQRVATAGGGSYIDVSNLNNLIAHLQTIHVHELDQPRAAVQQQLTIWRNGGIWLLPPLLLLASLMARRGWL